MVRIDEDKNNQNDEPFEKKLWKTYDKLHLTRLCDTLLSKLMSGEERVSP